MVSGFRRSGVRREGRSPDRSAAGRGKHRRPQIFQRRMRPRFVVIPPPPGSQDLRLQQGGKFLAVQMFVPQPAVERFHIRVLPRTPRLNVDGFDAILLEPSLHDLGDELRAVVAS